MEGMTQNYALLAITGIWTIMNFLETKNGMRDRRILKPILTLILFILVLIATIMKIDYMTFKAMIEGL